MTQHRPIYPYSFAEPLNVQHEFIFVFVARLYAQKEIRQSTFNYVHESPLKAFLKRFFIETCILSNLDYLIKFRVYEMPAYIVHYKRI
jgi:hypothetical protein